MESMNKKLMIIPTILLSSALLLTGCTSGNSNDGKDTQPSATSTDTSDLVDLPQPEAPKYVAPPAEMEEKYKIYFFSASTLNESAWAYYSIIGAKTSAEDSAARSTTIAEWEAARTDQGNVQAFDKMYGEINSDVEHTSLKVSEYLKTNSDATVEELNDNKDLIINRYAKVGKMAVEQDSATKLYFVTFALLEGAGEGSAGYGILVPQEGKTPDFSAK